MRVAAHSGLRLHYMTRLKKRGGGLRLQYYCDFPQLYRINLHKNEKDQDEKASLYTQKQRPV